MWLQVQLEATIKSPVRGLGSGGSSAREEGPVAQYSVPEGWEPHRERGCIQKARVALWGQSLQLHHQGVVGRIAGWYPDRPEGSKQDKWEHQSRPQKPGPVTGLMSLIQVSYQFSPTPTFSHKSQPKYLQPDTCPETHCFDTPSSSPPDSIFSHPHQLT